MDFRHVPKGLSQINKPHKNRSKSGGKVEVRIQKTFLSEGEKSDAKTDFLDKIIYDHWTRQ